MESPAIPALVDRFGRVHDYLRISLVDKCNLRCTYCMPESIRFLPQDNLMTAAEIGEMAKVFVGLGVNKIRLTGGEPLLRPDFREILGLLKPLNVKLALSTNGVLLRPLLPDLWEAGIRSINISLDSLNRQRVLTVTRRDSFPQVWDSIQEALFMGFKVKLNMVVMRGVNSDEIKSFVALTRNGNLHVRFIEFMPFDGNQWNHDQVMPYAEILETIQEEFCFEKLEDAPNSTTKAYRAEGMAGTFSVISTVTSPFCAGCNRIRLTAEGKIRNCLFGREELDLLQAMRSGQAIEPLIRKSIMDKAKELGGLPPFTDQQALSEQLSKRAMVKIGG